MLVFSLWSGCLLRSLLGGLASGLFGRGRLLGNGSCFLGGLGRIFAARLSGRYAGLLREPVGTGLDGALLLARSLP